MAGHWLFGLVGLLGYFETLMALNARPRTIMAIGIFGGIALIVAALTAQRRTVLLAAIVTLPFAVATWWTIVSPLVTIATLAIGLGIRPAGRQPGRPAGRLS